MVLTQVCTLIKAFEPQERKLNGKENEEKKRKIKNFPQ